MIARSRAAISFLFVCISLSSFIDATPDPVVRSSTVAIEETADAAKHQIHKASEQLSSFLGRTGRSNIQGPLVPSSGDSPEVPQASFLGTTDLQNSAKEPGTADLQNSVKELAQESIDSPGSNASNSGSGDSASTSDPNQYLEKWKELFNELDTTKQGWIEVIELNKKKHELKAKGVDYGGKVTATDLDPDGDGKITWDEFYNVMKKTYPNGPSDADAVLEQKWRELWNAIDTKGKGKIKTKKFEDKAEDKLAAAGINYPKDVSEEDLDPDGDGTITWDEFHDFMKGRYPDGPPIEVDFEVQFGPVPLLVNGNFAEGLTKCIVWDHDFEVGDDPGNAEQEYAQALKGGKEEEVADPIPCNPRGWINSWHVRRQDGTFYRVKPRPEATKNIDKGVYRINLMADKEAKKLGINRNFEARDTIQFPEDPSLDVSTGSNKFMIKECTRFDDCWWMMLLNPPSDKYRTLTETRIAEMTPGYNYTVSFDASRSPGLPCKENGDDWLQVSIVDDHGNETKRFDWPQAPSSTCGMGVEDCAGLCEVEAMGHAFRRYYFTFEAPAEQAVLRFENVGHISEVMSAHVWFSHVRMHNGEVTEETDTSKPEIVVTEEGRLVDMKARRKQATKELKAYRNEYSNPELSKKAYHPCHPEMSPTECEGEGDGKMEGDVTSEQRPCLHNGEYCVHVHLVQPGLANADFCEDQVDPNVDHEPNATGWAVVAEIKGWQVLDICESCKNDVTAVLAHKIDDEQWKEVLHSWHLPMTKATCIAGMIGHPRTTPDRGLPKDLDADLSRQFWRQTLRGLKKGHRYYLRFQAAQSHVSSNFWLAVRAIKRGQADNDEETKAFIVGHHHFDNYQFSWIAKGDVYELEFVSSMDTIEGQKTLLALTNMRLWYQDSLRNHFELKDPPLHINTLLCNMKGLTQDYIGFHGGDHRNNVQTIQGMMTPRLEDVCKIEWAEEDPYNKHFEDLNCTKDDGNDGKDDCVVCNAVMLATVLGWQFHLKAMQMHFHQELRDPATIVLALLKHPYVFRHQLFNRVDRWSTHWLKDMRKLIRGKSRRYSYEGMKQQCMGPNDFEQNENPDDPPTDILPSSTPSSSRNQTAQEGKNSSSIQTQSSSASLVPVHEH